MHIDVALARICVAAALLPGLAAQTTLPPGESRHEVSFGDRSSTVIVHVPAGLDAPVPLVLGLHGWFGSGAGFCASTRMGEHVDAMGFIGVCATGDGSSGENSWNAAGCCGSAVTQDVDDVGFLRAVVGWVDERAELTEKYTLGHSNGAMMAYVLPPCLLGGVRCCCRVGLDTGS